MKPQAASNQLRRLVDRGIVAPRRDGNHIHYRVVDACTVGLLDQGLCLAVCDGHAPVIITRKGEGSVVLMSLDDYEAMEETTYLLRVPKKPDAILAKERQEDSA